MLADVPDACTLPTADRPVRLAEFDTLFAATLRSQQRLDPRHLRLTLAGGPGLEATVRDLIAREAACCSFFGFTVTTTPDGASGTAAGTVLLDVAVPAAQAAVLDGLAERARQAAATGR